MNKARKHKNFNILEKEKGMSHNVGGQPITHV